MQTEDKTDAPPLAKETCASCGAKLKGDYCRKCGEKKIIPERDFSMAKFLTQTLGHLVHFDSKLLRSVWLLFSKPGFLTAEWMAGRRVNYMKPLQLFVVAGLLFYFFLPNVQAYFSTPRDLSAGFREHNMLLNTFHYDFGKVLTEKARASGLEEQTLARSVAVSASQQSKTWLFCIIPLWGLLIYLFFHSKIPWLAPHLIFAMHGLIFYILFDLSIHAILYIFGIPDIGKYIMLVLLSVLLAYQILAVRRVYGSAWPETILKTMGLLAGFVIILLLYRQVMTIGAISAL